MEHESDMVAVSKNNFDSLLKSVKKLKMDVLEIQRDSQRKNNEAKTHKIIMNVVNDIKEYMKEYPTISEEKAIEACFMTELAGRSMWGAVLFDKENDECENDSSCMRQQERNRFKCELMYHHLFHSDLMICDICMDTFGANNIKIVPDDKYVSRIKTYL